MDVAGRLWNLDGLIGAVVVPPKPPVNPNGGNPPGTTPPTDNWSVPPWPKPEGQKGEWFITRVPGAEAAFYLINFRQDWKHAFDSNNAYLYEMYVKAGFPVTDVSIKIVQDAKAV